ASLPGASSGFAVAVARFQAVGAVSSGSSRAAWPPRPASGLPGNTRAVARDTVPEAAATLRPGHEAILPRADHWNTLSLAPWLPVVLAAIVLPAPASLAEPASGRFGRASQPR